MASRKANALCLDMSVLVGAMGALRGRRFRLFVAPVRSAGQLISGGDVPTAPASSRFLVD